MEEVQEKALDQILHEALRTYASSTYLNAWRYLNQWEQSSDTAKEGWRAVAEAALEFFEPEKIRGERMELEVEVEKLRDRLDEILLKDRGKTKEINLLTHCNRLLYDCMQAALAVYADRGKIFEDPNHVHRKLLIFGMTHGQYLDATKCLGELANRPEAGTEERAEIERLRAENLALTARNARLEKGLEHYADKDETWARIPTEDVMGGQLGSSGYLSIYQAGACGWAVAREALAGTKEEKS